MAKHHWFSGCRQYKARVTTEAILGAITGSTAPRNILLDPYDRAGRLQYTGRSITLSQADTGAARGAGLRTVTHFRVTVHGLAGWRIVADHHPTPTSASPADPSGCQLHAKPI